MKTEVELLDRCLEVADVLYGQYVMHGSHLCCRHCETSGWLDKCLPRTVTRRLDLPAGSYRQALQELIQRVVLAETAIENEAEFQAVCEDLSSAVAEEVSSWDEDDDDDSDEH